MDHRTGTDEDIRARVMEGIPAAVTHTGPAWVGIAVAGGVVTLSGVVQEHADAVAAVRMAEDTDGVVAVRDELRWRHDGRAGAGQVTSGMRVSTRGGRR
ncbi:BON domain-containing protein [Nonomuraea sp. NPDC050643]|uniref:BON domain-containing protein n=1 Tax=Nonomuraea sp. NPDC050643 TaxID=3155660 RepID=UPI0033F71304